MIDFSNIRVPSANMTLNDVLADNGTTLFKLIQKAFNKNIEDGILYNDIEVITEKICSDIEIFCYNKSIMLYDSYLTVDIPLFISSLAYQKMLDMVIKEYDNKGKKYKIKR